MAQKTIADHVKMPAVARTAPGRGCRKDKMPVGTVVIRQRNKGGASHLARYIKVREDGLPQKRWILYARWWWEKSFGEIPHGKIVIHQDGDSLNDRPENLVLGTPGTKLVLVHARNQKWSTAQHERAAAGTANYNRLAGKLNRLRSYLPNYWYPVMDSKGLILNVPFKHPKKLLGWYHVDVSRYPRNGRARRIFQRAALELGIRPVRGRDLMQEFYLEYVKVDPEYGIGKGRTDAEERVRAVKDTWVYKRSQEAAILDLSDRK